MNLTLYKIGRTSILLLGIGWILACARDPRVGPLISLPSRPTEGIVADPGQPPAPQATRPRPAEAQPAEAAAWYRTMNKPRILLLVNRRFVGDAGAWRASTRVTVAGRKGQTVRSGEEEAKTKRTTASGRAEVQVDRRVVPFAESLSEQVTDHIRERLFQQFTAMGCILIDPEVAERLADAAASHDEGAEAGRKSNDVSAEAFLKHGDWIIEAILLPSGRDDQTLILWAKIVDLKTRRVLAVQSTQDMLVPARFPGAPESPTRAISVEEQVAWTVEGLVRQLKTAAKE